MKQVKVGMGVNVLMDINEKKGAPNDPVTRYIHARVMSVTDQDTITVSIKAGSPLVALRLGDTPKWRVNRFGVGG